MLPLIDPEDDRRLREEGLVLAKIAGGVEAQGPARGPLDGAEDVLEGVDGDLSGVRLGAVGQPDSDAAVVVCEGLEGLEGVVGVVAGGGGSGGGGGGGGGDGGGTLEADAEALCGAAGGGVEDVAGDAVFAGHDGMFYGVLG